MSTLALAGVGSLALAVALLAALVLVPRRTRVEITRLDPTARPPAHGAAAVLGEVTRLGDRVLVATGRRSALTASLERAGVRRPPAQVLIAVLVATAPMALVGGLGAGVPGAVALGAVVPAVAVVVLRVRADRRRAAFADQLDDTLRLMSSSLRAGHSVLRSVETVAQEAQSPTAEEFTRVLNEVRVGRDMVTALEEVAQRTASEDLGWVAQAVAIHREVGGNLAEVLDRVGGTIRDRTRLRRQTRALSAEGRASAAVLLSLPFVLGGAMLALSPGYLSGLTGTGTGLAMLAVAGLLMAVGAGWIRRIVTVRF